MENSSFFRHFGRLVAGRTSKYLTVCIWILVALILTVTAPAVNKVENNNAANLPNTTASVQAAAKVKAAFPSAAGSPALIVWYRKDGLTAQDIHSLQSVALNLSQRPLPYQMGTVPIGNMPASAVTALESTDKTTIVLPITFSGTASAQELQTTLQTLQTRITTVINTNPFSTLSTNSPGLHVRITGPVGIATDALGLFKNADVTLLAATTVLVLVLLILLYRSPILAFLPLVGVGLAYAVISPLLGILAKHGVITVDAQGISIMTVLLFGAGTDYCLFIVARYRETLQGHNDKHVAIREALGGSAGAVAMSGLTVVLSLLTLLLARYGADERFAIPFSLAVLIMALAGLTLVPALLAIIGRIAFFPYVPRTPDMAHKPHRRTKKVHKTRSSDGQPGRLNRWIGFVVTHHPWRVSIVSVILLGGLALFGLQMKTTNNLLDSFPQTMPSRQGYMLLATHFSPGALAPVDVLVESVTGVKQVESGIKHLSFVQNVSLQNQSGQNHLLSVTLKGDPDDNSSLAAIPVLKQNIEQSLTQAGVTNVDNRVYISGDTATQADTAQAIMRDTKVIIPIVIGVIAVLLFLYLRSIVATVYLILTVILSYFGALGAGWIVVHDILGESAVQGAIPLYAFIFLVALGEDYNIFMVSRIWQERRQLPLSNAIAQGVSRTSGVITSAGIILAGTFAVLASLPLQVLVQFGCVTAIGVLLDTFIVRPFLVPSITSILGPKAFWPQHIIEVHPTSSV